MYHELGYQDRAVKAYEMAVQLDPLDAFSHASLAGLYRQANQMEAYEKHITIAKDLIKRETAYNRACFEAICGNTNEALALLKTALDLRQVEPDWVWRDPDLAALRETPRFEALIRRYIKP
jgi:tetratricopeptide (TPR) repeat protein